MATLTLARATRLYESTCHGKTKFTSLAYARQAARKTRHCRGVKGLGAYPCPFCGMAHRGHIRPEGRLDSFTDTLREAAELLRAAGKLAA